MAEPKLYMLLLGCRPPGRHVEQHDIFFGIAPSLSELVPQIKAFWPEVGDKIHIDAWREVTMVDGYRVSIVQKGETSEKKEQLFFINLGGYQPNKFEEQHYVLLTVKENKAEAFRRAKDTLFYQQNGFDKAVSHIDDRYGIDVDDLYEIEDILPPLQKDRYGLQLTPMEGLVEDEIHLGYLPLSHIS